MLPIFLVIPTKLIPQTKDAAGNMFGGGGFWVIISSVYSCLYPNLFGEQSRPRKIHHPVVTTTTYSLIWWTIMSCTRYVSLYICRSTPTSISHKRKRRKKKGANKVTSMASKYTARSSSRSFSISAPFSMIMIGNITPSCCTTLSCKGVKF